MYSVCIIVLLYNELRGPFLKLISLILYGQIIFLNKMQFNTTLKQKSLKKRLKHPSFAANPVGIWMIDFHGDTVAHLRAKKEFGRVSSNPSDTYMPPRSSAQNQSQNNWKRSTRNNQQPSTLKKNNNNNNSQFSRKLLLLAFDFFFNKEDTVL